MRLDARADLQDQIGRLMRVRFRFLVQFPFFLIQYINLIVLLISPAG